MKLPDPTRPIEAQDQDVLLAMCVFGEARGECDEARQAVACVVRTRVHDSKHRYGHGWSGVILKKWQFSSFNPMDPNRPKLLRPLDWEQPETWARCWEVARKVYEGLEADNTRGATHYYDDSIAPPFWARFYQPTVRYGRLNFYKATPESDAAAARWRSARRKAPAQSATEHESRR